MVFDAVLVGFAFSSQLQRRCKFFGILDEQGLEALRTSHIVASLGEGMNSNSGLVILSGGLQVMLTMGTAYCVVLQVYKIRIIPDGIFKCVRGFTLSVENP